MDALISVLIANICVFLSCHHRNTLKGRGVTAANGHSSTCSRMNLKAVCHASALVSREIVNVPIITRT